MIWCIKTIETASWSLWYTQECYKIHQTILAHHGASKQTSLDLLRALAGMSAQELSANYLSRKVYAKPRPILRWLAILEDHDVWYRLRPYDNRDNDDLARDVAPKSKGYIIDTGLLCFLSGVGDASSLPHHDKWGSLFETWVINEIVECIERYNIKASVYHRRTKHGDAEVDCVIEYDGKLYPIEVKSRQTLTLSDSKGIAEFQRQHSNAQTGIILHSGTRWGNVSSTVIGIPLCV